jgi:hypothetical protein
VGGTLCHLVSCSCSVEAFKISLVSFQETEWSEELVLQLTEAYMDHSVLWKTGIKVFQNKNCMLIFYKNFHDSSILKSVNKLLPLYVRKLM